MTAIGSLVANMGLNVSQLRSGATQAQTIIAGLGANLRSKLGGIGGELTAMLGIGTAISSLGFGVKLAADAEQTAISFEVMLGSASRAKSMLAELKQYADTSPYESAGINELGKLLLTFGIQAQDVMPSMRMLGDIAAGDQEKFSRLALTFGQIASAGKLMGGDLIQLQTAGFNPLNAIAKKTGETLAAVKERMSAGGVSAGEVADALKEATSEGGLFFGMTDRQSKTTAGRFSTMKDGINTALKEAGEAILKNLDMQGVFEHINNFTAQVPFFFRNAGDLIRLATIDWSIYLMDVIPYGEQVAHSLVAGFNATWEGSKAGASAFVGNIKAVFMEIRNIASATWAGISAGIQALIKDPFNAMSAARQAFEKELASQKQPEGGKHFATAFASTFKETFSQTMKDLESKGGLKNSLKAQRDSIEEMIGKNELKLQLEAPKAADEGKLGDSFNRDVKSKSTGSGSKDTAESKAALFGSSEAVKLMMGGRSMGEKLQSQQLQVAQQMLDVLKTGFGAASKLTGKGVLNSANAFLGKGSEGLDPIGLAASLGSYGSDAIKSLLPGGPRQKTFGERRNDRIEQKRADELSNFQGLMGTVGSTAGNLWGSMMGSNTTKLKPMINIPSAKMSSGTDTAKPKTDPKEFKLLQEIAKGTNQPPVTLQVVNL